MNKKIAGKSGRLVLNIILAAVLIAVIAPLCYSTYTSSGSVAIKNQGASPNLQVLMLKYEPFPVAPGEYVDVWLKLGNEENIDARDLTIELVPEFPFSLDASETAGRHFGRILANSIVLVHYKVRVSEDAVEGDTYLKYRYKYVDSSYEWIEGYAKIRIQQREAVLSIESVETSPEKIIPGQEADVKIKLKNMATSVIRDVGILLDLSMSTVAKNPGSLVPTAVLIDSYYNAIPLVPIGSSTEKRFSHIKAGEEVEVMYRLAAFPDAESKIYKVPVRLTYQDELGRNYTKDDIVGIIIGAVPDLSITVDDDTVYSTGKVGSITIKIVNKGVSDVKFMNLVLKKSESYDIISSENVYVGDVDSDDYETADFKIYVKKLSKGDILEMPLHIEYKDANNAGYKDDMTLKLNAYSEKKRGTASSSKLWIAIFIIIVMVVAWFGYKRWEKKKKAKR